MKFYLEGFLLSQFHAVVFCYENSIGSTLPEQFHTEDDLVGYFGITRLFSRSKKRVLYRYTENSFNPDFWKLPPSTMIPVRNALQAICAYQLNRHKRFFGSGNLQDPTNLVCEQLKVWLFNLSKRDLAEERQVKQDINSYIAYIKTLEKNNVFPANSSGVTVTHERTMNGTLLEVAECLEKTITQIDEMVQRRTLRDVMTHITRFTKSVSYVSTQYLFYILRGNKTPAAINLDLERIHYLPKSILETRSFKLLLELLSSLSTSNPSMKFTEKTEEFTIHKNSAAQRAMMSDRSRQRCILNEKIGGNLIPDRCLFRRLMGGVHSGIELYFQNQFSILSEFVLLHTIIERIAHFSRICQQMEDLIDYFGMRIWAELGGEILKFFQNAFRELNNQYRACVEGIHSPAYKHYNDLVRTNKSSHWRMNFNTADRLHDTMLRDMELVLEQMSYIPRIVDRFKSKVSGADTLQIENKFRGTIHELNQFGALFRMQPITYPGSRDQHVLSLAP